MPIRRDYQSTKSDLRKFTLVFVRQYIIEIEYLLLCKENSRMVLLGDGITPLVQPGIEFKEDP